MSLFLHLHGEHYQSRRTHLLFERRENALVPNQNDEIQVERLITFEPMFLHCSLCESIKKSIQ